MAPEDAEAPRLLTAEIALDRFASPELLEGGKLIIVALDAVVARLGRRWELRRDQVYDHVERTFERTLAADSYCQRVSETDYLICQPSLSRAVGQMSCLRSFREILTHFLGDAREADRSILHVVRITPTAIEAEAIDPGRAERDAAEEQAAAPEASGGVPAPASASWILSLNGRGVRFSAGLEPVFELKTYRRIGYRLARRLSDPATAEELSSTAVRQMVRAEIVNIDLATIARGLDRSRAEASHEQHLTMITPVSYLSASHEAGRRQLIEALAEARAHVSCGVICQLLDTDEAPRDLVRAAVSLLRPHVLFVMADLSLPGRMATSNAAACGFQAASARCPDDLSEEALAAWAQERVATARGVAKSVLTYGVPSLRSAAILGLSGVSHASIRVRTHLAQ